MLVAGRAHVRALNARARATCHALYLRNQARAHTIAQSAQWDNMLCVCVCSQLRVNAGTDGKAHYSGNDILGLYKSVCGLFGVRVASLQDGSQACGVHLRVVDGVSRGQTW